MSVEAIEPTGVPTVEREGRPYRQLKRVIFRRVEEAEPRDRDLDDRRGGISTMATIFRETVPLQGADSGFEVGWEHKPGGFFPIGRRPLCTEYRNDDRIDYRFGRTPRQPGGRVVAQVSHGRKIVDRYELTDDMKLDLANRIQRATVRGRLFD